MAGLAGLTFRDFGDAGQVLMLGAHCDDIEIGCGATVVELAKKWPDLEFHAVILCSNDERELEARQSMASLLGDSVNVDLTFGGLRDGFLPYQPEAVKEFLIGAVKPLSPGVVFTHSRNDLHQDHRFIGELSYQVLRDSLILEMEIPKYDGDLDRQNVYFPVSEESARRKFSALTTSFPSQANKPWFSEETFASLMRVRGIECRADSGFAEAFHASKLVIR